MAVLGAPRLAAIAFLITAIVSVAWWWHQGRPQTIVDAPSARVPCVSYAPYRGLQTPFDETFVVPAEQIDADLRYLSGFTSCVRTYSSLRGLEEVPRLAAAHGLKVMQGAWVSQEREKTAAELDMAVALANRWPETVISIVVGNEVLLRREMPASALIALIDQTRARTATPLTYADVWEFWERHPEVAAHVDTVTIHTLPYWEDDPVAIGAAIPHVLDVWQRMQAHFPDRPVAIGEAGWPSAGRMREGALPSVVNQARFVRELLAEAEPRGIRVNLIEAFDQPWKRKLEGTVGGHWGLFDDDRRQKFELTGPVRDDPAWVTHLAAALGVAALFYIGYLARALGDTHPRTAGWFAAAATAHVIGTLFVVAVIDAADASRTIVQMIASGKQLLLAAATVVVGTAVITDRTGAWQADGGAGPLLAALAHRTWPRCPWRPAVFALVRLATLFTMAALTLTLVFDARYRDFPVAMLAIPTLVLLGLAVAGRPSRRAGDHAEERLLAVVVAAGAIVIAVNEGFANHQALAWGGVSALLAGPVLLRGCRRAAAICEAQDPEQPQQ